MQRRKKMEDTIGVGIFLSHTTFSVAFRKGRPSLTYFSATFPYLPPLRNDLPPSFRRYHPTNLTLLPYWLMRGGFSLEWGVFLFASHGVCGIAVE